MDQDQELPQPDQSQIANERLAECVRQCLELGMDRASIRRIVNAQIDQHTGLLKRFLETTDEDD